jgi:hypothetical protein
MKNIRNFALLILTVAAAIGANAQTSWSGKVRFPNEVRWGMAVLPAGEYSLSIPSRERSLRVMIRSTDGKTAAIVFGDLFDLQPGGNYIFVTGTGPNRLVRSINLPQLGFSIVCAPLTARERERLYATVSQTLPVQIAKK